MDPSDSTQSHINLDESGLTKIYEKLDDASPDLMSAICSYFGNARTPTSERIQSINDAIAMWLKCQELGLPKMRASLRLIDSLKVGELCLSLSSSVLDCSLTNLGL